MARVHFDRTTCGKLDEALKHEWLETNGLGGFASSTITGANTRRYHGLLVASPERSAARWLLLSKLEETLLVGDRRFDLSTNLYPGVIHPDGYRFLVQFRLDPSPIFTFEAGGVTLEKRVSMLQGENTVRVEYKADADCLLEVRPLIAFRGYHDLTHANPALDGTLQESAGSVSMQPYSALSRVWFRHNARAIAKAGVWYFNFEYPVEEERGLDFHEDLFCPFQLDFALGGDKPGVLSASLNAEASAEPLLPGVSEDPLTVAAAQFIVTQGAFQTIIAGYPWFYIWSRDAMIALPGLTLATGKFDVARNTLLAFGRLLDRGMLPNRLPESGEAPEYNAVDATLWFCEAARQYLDYTRDTKFVRTELYEKLKDVIAWFVRGTRFGIHMDADGLIAAGNPETQLTWMDARVGGQPVTARNGKPVEIQALWYNALRFVAKLAKDFDEEATSVFHEDLAMRARKSFNLLFWNEELGYFYDVIDGETRDASLRPNQLIALSLGYCAVSEDRARRSLAAIERHLLTPFGLRTLAPSDPMYRARYEGPPAERDLAYHQGTIWPWLLGPFVAANLRFNAEAAKWRATGIVDSLRKFMLARGTGQIPEIFDGDPPHQPRGCYAQAWSVAEVLRAAHDLPR
jgi:glycogen debranching enzyme